jgi:UbiD family decarboxylase
MGLKGMSSMRDVIDSFREEFIVIDEEVDPICEIAAIQKALDGSYALLFNKIKGYPGARCVGNVLSRPDRIAKIFGVADPKKLKLRCLEAIKYPILPKIVENAPCHEMVVTENIDVMKLMPILKHSNRDGARVLSDAIYITSGENFRGGMEVSFKRTNFRGKNWASVWISPGCHLEKLLTTELRGKDVPLTANICPPPAINLVAAAHFIHTVVPTGANEMAIAGGLQGTPIDIVKAKTVDAYAIANSEWVIEGYINTSSKVWETEEAEKIGEVEKRGMAPPYMPEWSGYLGRAMKVFKFQVTAITHRRDRPILHSILGRSLELDNIASPFREACFYEVAEQLAPGFVKDVHILPGVAASQGNVVFQVRKRRPRDEGVQRDIMAAFLALSPILQLVIAVDEDVDIYSTDDLLWAITTRCDTEKGIIRSPIRSSALLGAYPSNAGMGIDATVSWGDKNLFERAHYLSDEIDLGKWIPEDKIVAARSLQSEYAKILAKTGH